MFFPLFNLNAYSSGQGITTLALFSALIVFLIILTNYCCYITICKPKRRKTFVEKEGFYGELLHTSEYESGEFHNHQHPNHAHRGSRNSQNSDSFSRMRDSWGGGNFVGS
jgi:hypothetical protein